MFCQREEGEEGEEEGEEAAEGRSHLQTHNYNMTVQSTVLITYSTNVNKQTVHMMDSGATDMNLK